jgi:16S rRNA (guanine(1405)-N(7))-methyltransferase
MKQAVSVDPAVLAQPILASRKYRDLNLPPETVIDLIQRALDNGLKPAQAVDDARDKLHNIIAPYLGDPDYAQTSEQLTGNSTFSDALDMKTFCLKMLESHASTKERIPVLDDFYRQIFSITGTPHSILDLACAMHPFSLPWMNLLANCTYAAYDLHQPRVDLLNQFFSTAKFNAQAYYGDILLNPPSNTADVAFFFKEAHRFEQRQRGCNRAFWQTLNVRWLVVSLPASNLSGRFDLAERQRKLVSETLSGQDWPVTELQVGNELLFCINKGSA